MTTLLTSAGERNALQAVLDHFEEEEREDYLGRAEAEREGHIYEELLLLKAVLRRELGAQDLFPIARVVITPGAEEALAESSQSPAEFISRCNGHRFLDTKMALS